MSWEDIIKRRFSVKGARPTRYKREPETPYSPFKDSKGVNEAREAKRKEAYKKRKKDKDVKKAEQFNIKDLYFEEVFSMGMHRAEYEVNDDITLSIIGGAYYNSTPEKMLGDGDEYTEWEVGVMKNDKVIDQHPYMDEDDIRELIERLRKK